MKSNRSRLLFLVISIAALASLRAVDSGPGRDPATKALSVFSEVFSLTRGNYVDPTDSKTLLEGAYDGMTDALDPFSYYVPAASMSAFRAQQASGSVGPRIIVARRGGVPYVVAPLPGSPAEKLQVQPGDLIHGVDGTDRPPEGRGDRRAGGSLHRGAEGSRQRDDRRFRDGGDGDRAAARADRFGREPLHDGRAVPVSVRDDPRRKGTFSGRARDHVPRRDRDARSGPRAWSRGGPPGRRPPRGVARTRAFVASSAPDLSRDRILRASRARARDRALRQDPSSAARTRSVAARRQPRRPPATASSSGGADPRAGAPAGSGRAGADRDRHRRSRQRPGRGRTDPALAVPGRGRRPAGPARQRGVGAAAF